MHRFVSICGSAVAYLRQRLRKICNKSYRKVDNFCMFGIPILNKNR